MLNVKCKAKGFSVLETVIAMGIFVFIGLSIYLVYTSAFGLIRNSQIRIIATALATQQIEIARNLAYVNVGIEGVDIDGEIPNFQQISKGVFNFSLKSIISALQKLGKKLILRFGGELKTSPKLFSRNRQTSKDIYRLNVYFRPSELKKDDFITYKNQVYKIVSLSKKMNVKELLSNKNSVIKYDSEIKKVEPIYKTIVSKVKPVIEILDPETYQSTPVKNSKDVKMGEKVKVIKVSREFWLV